jgi:arylsulfatase A-like enzyme
MAGVADQTALAPTILELTGNPVPDWMEGQSLHPLLGGESSGQAPPTQRPALAFAQFLEANSVFAPVRRGTLGVIDGRSQYVLTLDSGTGALYDLENSDRQDHDRSAGEPALAARLHAAIARRFSAVVGARI